MNEKDFKKGAQGLKNIQMTDVEKSLMLERVFSMPIKSPYVFRIPVFALIPSFILILVLGGAVFASGNSLPGDLLYPIKVKVVEPALDVVNSAPEKKIVWEEKKVTTRIAEAESLVERDSLDDAKLNDLEQKIEKSSEAFVVAINAASSTATSTVSAKERIRSLKQDFRRKVNERQEIIDRQENQKNIQETKLEPQDKQGRTNSETEKIDRLKARAIKVLDDSNQSDNKSGE